MINQVARGPWLRKPADERIEDTFAQPSRHPSVRVPDPYAEVAPVAAEELITAKAGHPVAAAIIATMSPLSTPPDRKAPTGTSLTRCDSTARSNPASTRSAHSAGVRCTTCGSGTSQ